MQVRAYRALRDGGPMNWRMSARSMNATSMASVMFDVARISTFLKLQKKKTKKKTERQRKTNNHMHAHAQKKREEKRRADRRMRSSWVSRALTTRMASEGSVPLIAACRAAVRLST